MAIILLYDTGLPTKNPERTAVVSKPNAFWFTLRYILYFLLKKEVQKMFYSHFEKNVTWGQSKINKDS